eukprot:XP_028343919.1 uncharacterized protein LOC114486035 [Physeter catodon]
MHLYSKASLHPSPLVFAGVLALCGSLTGEVVYARGQQLLLRFCVQGRSGSSQRMVRHWRGPQQQGRLIFSVSRFAAFIFLCLPSFFVGGCYVSDCNSVVLNAGTAMQGFSCTLSPFPSPSSSSSSCSAAAAASPAASAVARSTFHSAEVAARLPSAAAAAAAPSAAAAVKPFDRELFRAFISAASRLFCDDEQIVVIDFLAHHEKAFTEKELSDRLRWGERRVREACAALERLMLIAKEHLLSSGSAAPRKAESHNENGAVFALHQQQEAHGGGGGGRQQQPGTSAPSYYRVSPFCFLVFQYRLQRMEQHVEMQRRSAESRDVFFCPACRTQYDALEAQLLDVHPQDAHFLCKFCNERLEHEDSRLLLQQVTSLQERCEKQLQVLKTLVRRGWNMQKFMELQAMYLDEI